MDKEQLQNEGTSVSNQRRRLVAALGGVGALLAAQPLLSGSGWGISVNGATYGNGSPPWRMKHSCHYASVADMKADMELEEGMYIRTAGYYAPGDGGSADYMIGSGTYSDDGGSALALQNGLWAILLPAGSVSYKQFGAVGDGQNDDGVQIKNAHDFANEQHLPISNLSGEFWIKQTNRITIQTSVTWGHTVFHIDERYNSRTNPRFLVVSRHSPIPIAFDEPARTAFLNSMKPGTTIVPELAAYKNCLVFVTDAQDRIGIRYGFANNTGWAKEEFFYVEEHGRLVGDIAWTFHNYTDLVAYPCDENYLLIEGGTFYLSGDSPGHKQGYWYNGFTINRSRTIIRNQWVGLEPGQADIAMDPRQGFYTFSRVYDVLLENVRLLPWEKDRPGTEQDVPEGTYGIGGSRTLNATFRNVMAEGSAIHWGVFGTNMFKNFKIESCRLNRVDVHYHCWNLYVKDSEIGYHGFRLTGGGDLFIENTKRYGNHYISFRTDYGAKWDGHIRLRNCRLIVENGDTTATALDYQPADFDYKYQIGYARSIRIEDFTFEYAETRGTSGVCQVIRIAGFSKIGSTGSRLFFPQLIELRNVLTTGRDKGVRIMRIFNPYSYQLDTPGGFDGQLLKPNCTMRFDNVQFEKVPVQASQSVQNVNFLLDGVHTRAYDDEYALYPKIEFHQVGDFFGHFKGAIADVRIIGSTVNCMDAYEGGPMRGRLTFEQCDFRPDTLNDGNKFYYLTTQLGTSFVDCTFHPPIVDGAARPDLFSRYDFIEVNHKLRYSHVNSRLSKAMTDYLIRTGTPVEPEFQQMLKHHHVTESELMARRKGTTAQRPLPETFSAEKGFSYFDTDLNQVVVWDGGGWNLAVKATGMLHFYVSDLSTAVNGSLLKRGDQHPLQSYVLPYAGFVSKYVIYVSQHTSHEACAFELWKNDSLWIGGIGGSSVSSNPVIAAPETAASFAEGDRIAVKVTNLAAGIPAGAYVTIDIHIGYHYG